MQQLAHQIVLFVGCQDVAFWLHTSRTFQSTLQKETVWKCLLQRDFRHVLTHDVFQTSYRHIYSVNYVLAQAQIWFNANNFVRCMTSCMRVWPCKEKDLAMQVGAVLWPSFAHLDMWAAMYQFTRSASIARERSRSFGWVVDCM